MSARFTADFHLGKLARLLRMLGFDNWYHNAASLPVLLRVCREEDRVLLSRGHHRHREIPFYQVESENAEEQLRSVLNAFGLESQIRPFSLCLICNQPLQEISKEEITGRLKENTGQYYHRFWNCKGCGRLYWEGSHFKRMQSLVWSVAAG